MTNQTKELPKDDSIKLTFSFPDVITVGHYQTYASARLKYIDDQPRGVAVPNNMAAYMGARALIMAGIVHIKSEETQALEAGTTPSPTLAERLKAMILNEDQTNTPVNVMQLVGGVIAAKVEAETLNPTLFGQSYSIDVTRNGT